MNIYDIKRLTKETEPYFFTADALKFFGQKMSMFKVKKQADGRYKITAPEHDQIGKLMGETLRYFNPINNKLENK